MKYDVNSYQFLFHELPLQLNWKHYREVFSFFFFYTTHSLYHNLEALTNGNASRERDIDRMEGWGETRETRVASLEPARGFSDDDWLW